MQNEHSEYFLSLQLLLKNYLSFVSSLNHYIAQNPTSSNKLKQLSQIWNHPKGISNLIRSIALKSNLEAPTPENLTQLRQSAPLPMIKQELSSPELIEVKNPCLEECVKQEEEQQMMDYSERLSHSKSKQKEMDESYSQSMSVSTGRAQKRGPYKSYSVFQKERAVHMLTKQHFPITEISRVLDIPCKNIKRWATEGVCRKRGGGRRRSCPLMESEVRNWIRKEFAPHEIVEIERIQEYALAVNKEEGFKASRGWVLKFIDRFHLRDKYVFK